MFSGRLLDRFGAQAVYGRPLGYGEMHRILWAEQFLSAHTARGQALNWATWAKENPEVNEMLADAHEAYREYYGITDDGG